MTKNNKKREFSFHMNILMLFLLLFFSFGALAENGYDPSLKWKSLQTENFIIHYHSGIDSGIPNKLANDAENIREKIEAFFNWKPKEKVHVVLNDRTDNVNGWATPLPRNLITLYLTPPNDLNELADFDEWLRFVFLHEYVHIVHTDKVGGTLASMRDIFGRLPAFIVFPLFPNSTTPNWMLEGIATWLETDKQKGIGRGQASMFNAMLRAESMYGFKSLREVNQPVINWPGGNSWYLYGVFFFEFLHETYGIEKTKEFFERYSRFPLPFFMNPLASQTWDRNFYQLWAEFEQWTRKRFADQLAQISTRGLHEGSPLTTSGYYTGQAMVLENGQLIYTEVGRENDPALVLLDPETGERKYLQNLKGNSFDKMRFDYDRNNGILISQITPNRNNNDFSDLYRYDLSTQKFKRLTHQGRYLFASWIPGKDEILAVQNQQGVHRLHRLNKEGKLLGTLWQGQPHELISSLDVNHKNQVIASIFRYNKGWNLEQTKLDNIQWQPVTRSSNIEAHARFIDDNRVIFSADYEGVYNIHQIDLPSGKIEQLTNVRTAALYPAFDANKSRLYFAMLGKDGFDLQQASYPLKKVSPGQIQPQKMLSADNATNNRNYSSQNYAALRYLKPVWWTPYWLASSEGRSIGMQSSLVDPLEFHNMAMSLGYELDNTLPEVNLAYRYERWFPTLGANFLRAYDYYYFSNGVLGAINRLNISQAYVELPWRTRTFKAFLAGGISYTQEKNSYLYPGLSSGPETPDYTTLYAEAAFDNTSRYNHTTGPANGIIARVAAEHAINNASDSYKGTSITSILQLYTPSWRRNIFHSVLTYGRATSSAKPFTLAFSPEILGISFADNKRISLRGYSTKSRLSGKSVAVVTQEWRSTLLNWQRGIMLPPVGISRLSSRLFVEAGATWDTVQPASSDIVKAAGVELLIEGTLVYRLPTTVTAGYAKGFDQGGEEQIYLSVSSPF